MSTANITVFGNLTRDPESGQMPDGKTPTSRFGIAVNAKRKGQDVVTYFRVNYIGGVANVANQYLKKGSQAIVFGELHEEQYTKSDGTPGHSLEIRGTNLQLVGGKPEQAAAASAGAAGGDSSDKSDDDIPF